MESRYYYLDNVSDWSNCNYKELSKAELLSFVADDVRQINGMLLRAPDKDVVLYYR